MPISGQRLTNPRQDVAKVPTVEPLKRLPGGYREFEHCHSAPRSADACHLPQALVAIGYVAESECHADDHASEQSGIALTACDEAYEAGAKCRTGHRCDLAWTETLTCLSTFVQLEAWRTAVNRCDRRTLESNQITLNREPSSHAARALLRETNRREGLS